MLAPSIIIKTCKIDGQHKKRKYNALVGKEFMTGALRLRLATMLYRRGIPGPVQCAESYSLTLRSPAAARYFHKRLAELMLELDGTVVIEDPPGTSGAA